MLRGVPVVAGIQYAPVIRPGRLPAVDDDRAEPDIDEADRPAEAARFGAAAAAVATRLRDRAAHATGAASEVLAATATLAQDRAWLGAAEKRIKDGTPAVARRGAGGRAVRRPVHPTRRADGRTRHRSPGHPRPRHRRTERPARARRPAARRGVDPVRRGPGPGRHRGLDPALVVALATTLGGPTSHTAIIARQLGIPCVVAVDGLDAVARRDHGDGRRHPGHGHRVARPGGRGRGGRAAQREAQRAAHWSGPGATADGHAVPILANVQDGAAARSARRNPGRGRRPVPHRTVFPQPRHRTERRRAGTRSMAKYSRRSRATRW